MTKRELYKLFDEVIRETERESRFFESLVYATEQDTPEKEILTQGFTETDWPNSRFPYKRLHTTEERSLRVD